MNKLETYIKSCFNERKWFFISSLDARQAVGESFEADLNELKERQMIRIREGINGKLIQIINPEKWNFNNKNK